MTRSLELRLLAFAGIAIAGALVVAWVALGALFERHAERQLQSEMERHGLALIAAVSLDPQQRPVLAERPFDPRFGRPAAGLYWRIRAPGGELRSRSLWDGDLPALPAPPARGWGAGSAEGPFEPRVMVIARDIQPDPGGPQILIEVAADRAPLAAARAAFNGESALFLALLWLTLALAAWVQVRLGLRPLARVRREMYAMRQDSARRLATDGHPTEIQPLTTEINAFADGRAEDVLRARRRARDLAHALKTPLTALRLQIESLDPDRARDLAQTLSFVAGAVEGELAHTGADTGPRRCAARPVIDRLIAVISRTPEGGRLTFDIDVAPDLLIPLGEEAALETLGALLENAARHATSAIHISGETDSHQVRLTLSDDGPGISPEQRASALDRGVRLDEAGPRHGLGLSIAADFVRSTGGTLALGDAPNGGLAVSLTWPVV